jgi:hypothetical protein
MSVEFVPAAEVRELQDRIVEARRLASEEALAAKQAADDPAYWERLFESNAAAALGKLRRVQLPPDRVVRYRFYGRRGADLLVRPFVARTTTDVSTIRQLIDWHPAPDSVARSTAAAPTRDVEFLYRHFAYERSARGYYEYWIGIQELWASARWVHSRVIADGEDFAAVVKNDRWQLHHEVQRYEPAVVVGEESAQLAVLLFCPLERQSVTLHRIEIGTDQDVRFVESIDVALGPRGYLM